LGASSGLKGGGWKDEEQTEAAGHVFGRYVEPNRESKYKQSF
jgi:hypothetical protein